MSKVAVIVAGVPPFVPALTTSPERVTTAVAMALELQVTTWVTSCTGLPLTVIVAVNCWLVPSARFGLAGVIVNPEGVALFTVKLEVEAFTDPNTAEMFDVPGASAVATPALVPKS
jgi:hypothetical protein